MLERVLVRRVVFLTVGLSIFFPERVVIVVVWFVVIVLVMSEVGIGVIVQRVGEWLVRAVVYALLGRPRESRGAEHQDRQHWRGGQ